MKGQNSVGSGKICALLDARETSLPQKVRAYEEVAQQLPFELCLIGGSGLATGAQLVMKQASDWSQALRSVSQRSDVRLVHAYLTDEQIPQLPNLWSSGAKPLLVVELAASVQCNAEISQLLKKYCAGVVVVNAEQRISLIAQGISADRVRILDPLFAQSGVPSAQERSMLRRAWSLPDQPLTFAEVLPAHYPTLLGTARTIVTGDTRITPSSTVLKVAASSASAVVGFVRASDLVLVPDSAQFLDPVISEAILWNVPILAAFRQELEHYYPAVRFYANDRELKRTYTALINDEAYQDSLRSSQRTWLKSKNSKNLAQQLQELYQSTESLSQTSSLAATKVASLQSTPVASGAARLRVLMQLRPNAQECPGGDTEVLRQYVEHLQALGVTVVVDHSVEIDYRQFDLVHLFNFAVPQLLEHYARAAQAAGVPFVVTSLNEDLPRFYTQGLAMAKHLEEYVQRGQRSSDYRWSPKVSGSLDRATPFNNEWVARNAALLLSCGPSESLTLRQQYPGAKIKEIFFGFRSKERGSASYVEENLGVADYILCVGRLEFRKNQLGLLKALEESDRTVILAGGGFSYFPEYVQAAKQFRRRGKTLILDRVSDEDLAHLYAGAKVHCLPSWYELPGLVSLEAAAQGCGVVATRYGAAADYLGKGAYYCEPDDVGSIRAAIEAACEDSRSASLQEQLRRFSWERSAEQLLLAYQEVIAASVIAASVRSAGKQTIVTESARERVSEGVDFTELLKAGEAAAKQHQYASAIDKLKQAIKLNDNSARAQRALGAVYLAQDRLDLALPCMEKAVALDAYDARALSGYGMVLLKLNQPQRAHELFLKSLELAPFEVVTLFQLVQTSQALSSFDELRLALRRYCHEKPEDLDMRFCLAGACFQAGDFAGAQEYNTQVLSARPEHAGATQLTRALAELPEGSITQKFDEKVEGRRQVFDEHDLKLSQIDELKRRGELQAALGELEQLVDANVLQREDQAVFAEVLKGECLLLSGALEEGKRIIASVYARHGGNTRVMCAQGAVSSFEGDWETARQLFDRALLKDPSCDMAIAGIGACQQQSGAIDEAWRLFHKALDLNPESKRALLGVIQLGFQLQRFEELEGRLRDYLELHPAAVDFLYSLAGCLYAQGRYDEALEQLSRMQIFAPEHKDMLELIELIQTKLPPVEDSEDTPEEKVGLKLSVS